MENIIINNVNHLEKYIRISHNATGEFGNYVVAEDDWLDFPTPSEMPYTLNDVDKDPFTDLAGFTHRNRVRTDVITFDLVYKYMNEDTQAYILQAIEPEWFYVEIIHPKKKTKTIHKVYASSKKFNVLKPTPSEYQITTDETYFSYKQYYKKENEQYIALRYGIDYQPNTTIPENTIYEVVGYSNEYIDFAVTLVEE